MPKVRREGKVVYEPKKPREEVTLDMIEHIKRNHKRELDISKLSKDDLEFLNSGIYGRSGQYDAELQETRRQLVDRKVLMENAKQLKRFNEDPSIRDSYHFDDVRKVEIYGFNPDSEKYGYRSESGLPRLKKIFESQKRYNDAKDIERLIRWNTGDEKGYTPKQRKKKPKKKKTAKASKTKSKTPRQTKKIKYEQLSLF